MSSADSEMSLEPSPAAPKEEEATSPKPELKIGMFHDIEGWAQDWRKSDGCFSPNLISSP